jgi:hypothetical protein
VVEEGVFWPEIPANVIANATALHDALIDPVAAAAFRNKLPVTVPDKGDIVIHHSPGTPGAQFQSVATFDILDRSGGIEKKSPAHDRDFWLGEFGFELMITRAGTGRRSLRRRG